jgi:hypothetical protein
MRLSTRIPPGLRAHIDLEDRVSKVPQGWMPRSRQRWKGFGLPAEARRKSHSSTLAVGQVRYPLSVSQFVSHMHSGSRSCTSVNSRCQYQEAHMYLSEADLEIPNAIAFSDDEWVYQATHVQQASPPHHRAAVTDLSSTVDGPDVQANVSQVCAISCPLFEIRSCCRGENNTSMLVLTQPSWMILYLTLA